ncbi:YozE family protein [Streptomyces sp. NPDC051907]|uniref:YozE family protein n=1 Tax=Streptomyces sp. NPDC051907 TaxID=3155284 RepID=UPI003416064D
MDGFTAWLLRHVTDQDAIGELARRADADPDWPEGPDRLRTFTDHLEGSGAKQSTLQNLMDAWVRYASHWA